MASEELLEIVGREKSRVRVSGQITDEDGAGIDGSTLTKKTCTIYNVDDDTTLIRDHEAIAVDGTGNYSFWISSDEMTIVNTDMKAGSHERHRVLLQFGTATPGREFNFEFDVLVRKVKHLA